jgi:isoleucyl-tRNA synthetase
MGANLPKGRVLIEALPGRETMDLLERDGKFELEVDGTVYDLTLEDLLIEEVPATGFAVESAGSVTIALNTVLSEQLIEEGLVREMVSKIQTMRRSSDFLVTDRIDLYVKRDDLADVIDRHIDSIMDEVLAQQVIFFDAAAELPEGLDPQSWDINGHDMTFAVRVP